MRIVIEELRDLGGRVLVLGQLEARRRASGARVNTPIGIVTDFRGCKMSRSLGYFDHGEALRAVGLAH